MKFSSAALLLLPCTTGAFSPTSLGRASTTSAPRDAVMVNQEADRPSKPIYDPLGLYPTNSLERQNGWIHPLESSSAIEIQQDSTVVDPLSLYPKDQTNRNEITEMEEWMSASLPFAKRPDMLDGSLPGDRGFDPFNFSSTPAALDWYRTAEIKHARLAMLAAIGWPLSEALHDTIAKGTGWTSLLVPHGDRVPSVLNGGLDQVPVAFWVAALAASVLLETAGSFDAADPKAYQNNPTGDFGFDPFKLSGGKTSNDRKFFLQESELFHGRMGMLAITTFALQEFW
eukprot:CAMPEP_0117044970 /NCGR_PEP_ID=MMETSP0472-20121206/31135_1 /TAXON_ID=693140 ORGANISM="Tiarina fusus, Strain LIS" /NCGR_SAMPLE_ID=MMETSP0472 /ASSEMBLY_ACC=CAM_ASM_000603 /LENGTH=284 /DNA_ID=CAMNT_0004756841 /DNA_START=22 /DNA_END=873 /DNA_ORIENTATION=-